MTQKADEMLRNVKELAQNACAGYSLRASAPYGTVEGKPISEADIVAIINETDKALNRLSEAIQMVAEFVASNEE